MPIPKPNSGDGGNRTRARFPQKSRSTSGCECGGPCFYCGQPLRGAHDHDHFPIPYRHGGRETVPACQSCHSLKDRIKLKTWPPSAQRATEDGLDGLPPSIALILPILFAGAEWDEPSSPHELAPFIRAFVEACTTPEARIAAAKGFCHILDRDVHSGRLSTTNRRSR